MSKVLSFITALALVAGMFTSCDKHAYSISTNEYRCVLTDGSVTPVSDKKTYTIDKGQTLYFYASDHDGNRLTGGKYEPRIDEDQAGIVTARAGSFDGDSCIEVTGKKAGMVTVMLNFTWRGFKLYKSARIQVNE